MRTAGVWLAIWLAYPGAAAAADLVVDTGGAARATDTGALLARPDVATITVPLDATFGRAMTYRAVPLRAVLGLAAAPEGEDIRLIAADGFITDLPAGLVFPAAGKAEAEPWLAIEPADQPWPPAPGGGKTGPFYLVWLDPAASGILREQWPFAVVKLTLTPSAASRWPQLEVAGAAADSLAREGQDLVATQCMVCHPVAGGGDAAVGPDLTIPRSPTEYFEPWAFRAYVRDPASLRHWEDMRMPGFSEDVLSDHDVDAIVAYLTYLAERREGAGTEVE